MVQQKKKIYKFAVLIFITVSVIIIPLSVKAILNTAEQEFKVAQNEIVAGDFIKVGKTVSIEGKVEGDVIVASSVIEIKGIIGGDLIAVANDIKIEGEVMGNVRIAGNNVLLSGKVGRNANIFGSSVILSPTSSIGKNIYATAAHIQAQGQVLGNFIVKGTDMNLDNEVTQNTYLRLGRDAKAVIGSKARYSGNFEYESVSKDQVIISPEAKIAGTTEYKVLQTDEKWRDFFNRAYVFGKIIYLFGLLIVGLVFISLIPKKVHEVYDEMIARPYRCLMQGCVAFVMAPLIMVLLFITIIGIPLALIMLPLYFIFIYFGKVIAGITVGNWLLQKFYGQKYSINLMF